MSTPQQQQPQLNGQQAHAMLLHNGLIPLYFAKLAEYGRQPVSEDDAQAYATMCMQVLQARERGLLKLASDQATMAKYASAKLGQYLGGQQAPVDPQHADDMWAKQAAAQMVQSPELCQAVVAYQTQLLAPQA